MAESTKKETMTKRELIRFISKDRGIRHTDVRHVVQAFLDKMTECLQKGSRLEFRDFGIFEVVQRKQKIGRNPRKAAQSIVIPARKAVKFTPGKKMRRRIETPPAKQAAPTGRTANKATSHKRVIAQMST